MNSRFTVHYYISLERRQYEDVATVILPFITLGCSKWKAYNSLKMYQTLHNRCMTCSDHSMPMCAFISILILMDKQSAPYFITKIHLFYVTGIKGRLNILGLTK